MGRRQTLEIRLTEEERAILLEITSKGVISVRELKRAQIILKCDRTFGEGLGDEEVARMLDVSKPTVFRARRSFLKDRLTGLKQKKGAGRPKIIDGDIEAHMIAIACSSPPDGRVRWTLQLIANKVVLHTDLDSISHQTVKNVLKKTNLNRG